MNLQGRTAIVTGGAVRVGAAISAELAKRGAAVFIHYNRSKGPAESLRDEIVEAGGVSAIGSVNLSAPEAAGALVAVASETLGTPTILINSASAFPTDSFEDVTIDGFRKAQDLGVTTPLMLVKALAQNMSADDFGAVVNVTDVKTLRPYREHLSYMIAKGALDTLTRAAALSLAPRIRVNAVALGVVLPPAGESAEYALDLAKSLPLQRVGGAQVVADAVAFLCENDFITGEILRLDGGAHLV